MISTDYHTDDFYQRMLDLGSGRMNSGFCEGGPWHGRRMHDIGISYRVAVDQHSKKAFAGMISSPDPGIQFHEYRFADGAWTWHESAQSAPPKAVNN